MLASVWHFAVAPEGTSTLEIRFPGDPEPKHKVQDCELSHNVFCPAIRSSLAIKYATLLSNGCVVI